MTSQEVGEGGIMNKDRKEGVCVVLCCVCEKERLRPRGRELLENLERRGRDVCREGTVQKQIGPAQHVLLHPPHLGWWHYSNHSPNQYL